MYMYITLQYDTAMSQDGTIYAQKDIALKGKREPRFRDRTGRDIYIYIYVYIYIYTLLPIYIYIYIYI